MSYGNDSGASMAGAHWVKQNAAKGQIEIEKLEKGWLSHRQDAVSHEPTWKQMTCTRIESSTIQSQRSTLPLSHVPVLAPPVSSRNAQGVRAPASTALCPSPLPRI